MMKWADRKAKLRRDFEREMVEAIRISFPDLPPSDDAESGVLNLVSVLGLQRDKARSEALELVQAHGDLSRQRDEANKVLHRILDTVDPGREVGGPVFNAAAAILARQFRCLQDYEEACQKAGLALAGKELRGTRIFGDAIATEVARRLWEDAWPELVVLAERAGFNLALVGRRTPGEFVSTLRSIREKLEATYKEAQARMIDMTHKAGFSDKADETKVVEPLHSLVTGDKLRQPSYRALLVAATAKIESLHMELGGCKMAKDGAEVRADHMEADRDRLRGLLDQTADALIRARHEADHPIRTGLQKLLARLQPDQES